MVYFVLVIIAILLISVIVIEKTSEKNIRYSHITDISISKLNNNSCIFITDIQGISERIDVKPGDVIHLHVTEGGCVDLSL